jgi:small subunit ribosomal protein S2
MVDTSIKSLLEAGVHFGHQTHRWNPKMAPFLFGDKSGIHIIDLDQTMGYLHEAQKQAEEVTAAGGNILFVGTKRQGKEAIKAAALRAGMPYVIERWLGGMLTNFETIKTRLKRLADLTTEEAAGDWERLPKKELARKREERDRLEMLLGGIRDLKMVPNAVFIGDVMREDLAVKEAKKLEIPIIGVIDSNADPRGIDYPIPGNDDAVRSIAIIAEAIADAAIAGKARHEKAAAAAAKEQPETVEATS